MSAQVTPKSSRTALYRVFGAGGQLLYVGIGADPTIRWRRHAKDQPWWPDVTRLTVEWFETRNEARLAEAVAIRDERPRWNVAQPYDGSSASTDPSRPVLDRPEVAHLLGVKPKTVSQYLVESRGEGRYAGHPFPPPDGYIGSGPYWWRGRQEEFAAWASRRTPQSDADMANARHAAEGANPNGATQ